MRLELSCKTERKKLMDSVTSASFSNYCLTRMSLRGIVKANTLPKSSGSFFVRLAGFQL